MKVSVLHASGCKENNWSKWCTDSLSTGLLGLKLKKCHLGVYKYSLGGAGEENKCTIYILIVFYGAIFRKVFPIVS